MNRTMRRSAAVVAITALGMTGMATAASAAPPSSSVSATSVSAAPEQVQPSIDFKNSTTPQALPIIALPVIIGCVGAVSISVYQAYRGGDPVLYIANAILSCVPFGAAAKPAIVAAIKANPKAVATALRAVGAGTLATALTADSAG